MSIESNNPSGKTMIKDGYVVLEFNEKKLVNIPIDRIKLIAEYTTANGPFLDDWFLVIYNDKSEYFEISMYTENIQEMITELGELMNLKLIPNLSSSTEWKSTILFPSEFLGKDLWTIVRPKPKSTIDKLKSLIGIKKTEFQLSKTAEKIIERKNQ